ncbi:hypothetical protein ACNF42_04220 [Cuniculiplasma sp. SKW3]|uniref:hypothetical protein n=1 Tax=Cuniculiplasma sp. SKW3 TaxID=3400170 RepID=UPI003FD3B528
MSDNQIYWERFRYALSGFAFIIIPFLSIDFVSYLNTAAIVNGWILVIVGFLLLLYFSSLFKGKTIPNYLIYIGLILSIIEVFFVVSTIFPNAYTDEIIIQYYAAKIFTEGKDPYINSNMVNVFKTIKPNPIYVTPQLNGGIVNYLLYPGMSVLAFIPAAYFGLPDYTDLFVISVLLFLVVFWYTKKKDMLDSLPFLALLLALDISFFGFSVGGSTDVLWVFFLVLAYIYKDRPEISGFLYGLSLSSKQIAVIVLPFFMYYMFREKGNSWKQMFSFFALAVISFLLSNLPFIIMGYHQWLRNIVEAEFQPVIGIGVGFSEVVFSGIINIPSRVFAVLLIMTIAIMLVIYIRFYDKLKYAFFSFPIIIFLFNYRVLMGYIIDWGMLIILTYADFVSDSKLNDNKEQKSSNFWEGINDTGKKIKNYLSNTVNSTNLKAILVILIIFVAGIGGTVYVQYTSPPTNVFVINSITNMSSPQQIPCSITSMDVNITYNPTEGMSINTPVFFRILTNNATEGNYNGLIWKTNKTISPGHNNIQITPISSVDIITNASIIRVQAYYDLQSKFFTAKTNYTSKTGFSNYEMDFPEYKTVDPYVSWAYVSALPSNDTFNYIQINGKQIWTNGFNLTLYTPRLKDATNVSINRAYLIDPYVNLTYLARNNAILRFNYSISGNGTNSSQLIRENYSALQGIEFLLPDQSSVFIILEKNQSDNIRQIMSNYYIFQRSGSVNFTQVFNLAHLLDSNLNDLNNISVEYFVEMGKPGSSYFSAWNFYLS